ncbi:DUF4334 domain-containing protein [Rhodococcus sp. HNM0569]|uniref:DUF4334 domain-containing protein n=1 Tax=Rhodococcus sp. HNM0569 TaxID=2716340 RepID=UPI00146D0DC9|nr:DUF4334 domain-containing protein [Rhodococcus sp. HNM0569]NLU81201.1 DUF4334 domain-containing protein [Rhodococcus sp. HNM0569]
MTATLDFHSLTRATGHVDPRELDAVWAGLKPAHLEQLTGLWKGGAFDTGHRAGALLDTLRWYGKRFDGPRDVDPLVCVGEDGQLVSNLEAGKGRATLWNVEFRGETTATMVYDGMPVFDHFKRVDDDTVMGIMNGKGIALDDGEHFYFWLERVRS